MRQPGGQIACMDDDMGNCVQDGQFSTINFAAAGAHLFWVIVDGAGGSPNMGAFEVDFNFQ